MARSYRLLEKLGEGAFGEVHLAEVREEDEDFVQVLAVKRLHAQYSHDVGLAGRLRDEARLLALLQHENVVRVHGLTRLDGRLAVLMEAVDGVDMAAFSGEAIPAEAGLAIIAGVADALGAAWNTHPRGASGPLRVVHRDIKPSNIMVTRNGGVKVMDFGVARAHFDAREVQTRSQQFGTARYMAPERWLLGESDAPSDIFSLGITLLEMVSGTEVERFRLAPTAFAADLEGALERLDDLPEIRALVAAMCAMEASDRPTAADVGAAARSLAPAGVEALREWAAVHCAPGVSSGGGTPTVVAEDGSAETFALGDDVPSTTSGTAPAELPRGPVTSRTEDLAARPWFWPVLASLFVVAVLFGVYVGGRRAAPPPDQGAPVAEAEGVVPASPSPDQAPAERPEETELVPPVPEEVASPAVEAPAPVVSPVVSPRPTPVSAPPPPNPEETGTVTFVLEPTTLSVATTAGPAGHRRALALPLGPQVVRVLGGTEAWECTVPVRRGHSQYVVRDQDRTCVPGR